MRLLSHPVTQFLIAGAVALLGVVWATSYLASKAAMREAVGDARGSTQILASSVAEPALPRGLVSGSAGAIDRFDRTVLSRLQVDNVVRIKIWDRHGRVVYSDAPRLIGDRYALGEEEKEVIVEGGVDAEFSDLSRPENRFEVDSGGALEVYTRIRSPEGEPLLFEVYFSADHVAQRQHDVMSAFRVVTLGGLLLLITLATPWCGCLPDDSPRRETTASGCCARPSRPRTWSGDGSPGISTTALSKISPEPPTPSPPPLEPSPTLDPRPQPPLPPRRAPSGPL